MPLATPTIAMSSTPSSSMIPATAETKKSIGNALLSSMPKGGVLVNTARAEVIDEPGLLENPDVLLHPGQGHPGRPGQIRNRSPTLTKPVQNPHPDRVSQSRKSPLSQLRPIIKILNHKVQYSSDLQRVDARGRLYVAGRAGARPVWAGREVGMRPRETPVYERSEYEVPGRHAGPAASRPGPAA